MSRSENGFDWHVDKRSALAEQFPTLRQVANERPGTERDRARRRRFEFENRLSLDGARRAAIARAAQEADADRFIEEMQARKVAAFAEKMKNRRSAA